MHYVGLGSIDAPIYIYIENTPPLPFYQQLDGMHLMQQDEIFNIAQQTGNHWRKIFNVFAKLEFERSPQSFTQWQHLRDEQLLQENAPQCLLFNGSEIVAKTPNKIHIVMGKTYAAKLAVAQQCLWLNEFFAIDEKRKIIICPYFDYRQLSNLKISQLARLIDQLS